MSAGQSVLSEDTVINIQDNSGQVAIGNYIVQIGSVHGGVVNVAMPEQQPRPRLRPSPVMLRPRPFPDLLDRKPETGTALMALPAYQPVEFYGQAGLGKTSLLRYLAYQLPLDAWSDGVIYYKAGQQPAADLLQFLFEAFYESDTPFKPTDAQLHHALQSKQALILLDDVNLDRDEIELLLDTAPACAFLLASPSRHLWGEGQVRGLSGLPQEDALALFERELARPLTPEEDQVAPMLCTALDGHPLHLLQAATMIRESQRSLPEFIHQLQQDKPDHALAAQIIAALSGPERQVVGLLAAMNGAPLHDEHLTAMTGRADLASVLEALLERKVIQSHSPRYSLTGTLDQSWSQTRDLAPIREQLLDYLTRWAEQNRPTPERLLEEMSALTQIQNWATNSGRWQETLRIGRAIEESLTLTGRWGTWEKVLQATLQAAEAISNQAAEAWALHQLGTRALCLDDFPTAQNTLRQALALRESLGDWAGAAITRHNLDLLVPPPMGGQTPTETPPTSPSAPPSTSTSFLLELGTSAVTLTALITALILLAVVGVLQLIPGVSSSTTVASPTNALNVVFVTITPILTPTPTMDTPTPMPPTITNTPTATGTPSPSPTNTFTPSPTPSLTPTQPIALPPGNLGCQPPSGWVAYIVQPTDTLNSLARQTNTTVFELQQGNCLTTFTIQSGQTIYLPTVPPTPTITNTPTATGTPSPSPTRQPNSNQQQPQIISVNPASGEVDTEVIVLVRGRNFRSNNANFRAELIGDQARIILTLTGLKTDTAFEAIVPSTLPVGIYDLLVTNPDNRMAVRSAAYEVTAQPVTITPEPSIMIEPEQLSFAEQLVGNSSQPMIVTLANIGQSDLILNDINLTGTDVDDFTLKPDCPATLPPNQSCELVVGFRPVAAGARAAAIIIFSNVNGSPHRVLLSGSGRPGQPDLIVTLLEQNGAIDFGPNNEFIVPVRAIIANQGNAAADIFKIAMVYTGGNLNPNGPNLGAFQATNTDEVISQNGFAFTLDQLLPDNQVTLEGVITFDPREQRTTVSLRTIADSCFGERVVPEPCRVAESDEDNNESIAISLPLFDVIID